MKHLILLCSLVVSSFWATAQEDHDHNIKGSDTVFVSGLVRQPFYITRNDHSGLQFTTHGKHDIVNGKGEVKQHISTFKGVALKDLMIKAGVDVEHKDQGRYFVVVTATDGYQVVFAYNELLYTVASGAYLVDAIDGEPADDGPFVLLSTGDRPSAPRHVKWVRSIELRKI